MIIKLYLNLKKNIEIIKDENFIFNKMNINIIKKNNICVIELNENINKKIEIYIENELYALFINNNKKQISNLKNITDISELNISINTNIKNTIITLLINLIEDINV